jgi:hypothetical protein
MSNIENSNPKKLGAFPYVMGGMSFIPLLGVPFGLVAIVWGLLSKKKGGKLLAGIGALGIGSTFALYGGLFYFGTVQRGGVYDGLRVRLAQSTINELVPSIEFYRIQQGRYPQSLKALKEFLGKESFVFVFDPSVVDLKAQPRYFFYERVGADHYYLRGLGIDGKPFTNDDVLPQVTSTTNSKMGLLLERKKDS